MSALPAWSYSMLDSFENCPRKTYHRYILKEKEPDSPALVEGRAVHEALDRRIRGDALPEKYLRFSAMAESVAAAVGRGMKVYSELKMGLTRGMEACSFWDDGVWGRGAADVILKKDTAAAVLDWKTGKKREKPDQLSLLALFVFTHFPAVERVTGANLWLEPGEVGTPYAFSRADTPALWQHWLARIKQVETAQAKNAWPEKPSGLCAYCPVKQCRHNRS